MFKKDANVLPKQNMERLNSIISTVEEIMATEEKMYAEYAKIKSKLDLLEISKAREVAQIEEEREKIQKLYQYEKFRVDEVLKAKEVEKNNEIEEYKRKLKKESDFILETKINKLQKMYKEENAARIKIFEEYQEYKNKTKEEFEKINAVLSNSYSEVQEKMSVLSSVFAQHLENEKMNLGSFETLMEKYDANDAENIENSENYFIAPQLTSYVEEQGALFNVADNVTPNLDDDYIEPFNVVDETKEEMSENVVDEETSEEQLLLQLHEERKRQLVDLANTIAS